MGDTSKFAVDSKFGGALVYRHPTKPAKDYPKVWLDSAEVLFANPSSTGDAYPKELQEFIAFWRGEVEKHLAGRNFTRAQRQAIKPCDSAWR